MLAAAHKADLTCVNRHSVGIFPTQGKRPPTGRFRARRWSPAAPDGTVSSVINARGRTAMNFEFPETEQFKADFAAAGAIEFDEWDDGDEAEELELLAARVQA